MSEVATSSPRRVPLHALHEELGAKFAPFAGFEMPASYPDGVIAEHLRTRGQAGLFDVTHMAQLELAGVGVAAALERLAPVDAEGMEAGAMRYALLTNDAGGVVDDVIITRRAAERFGMVVNASRREVALAHLRDQAPEIETRLLENQALLALQGPKSAAIMKTLASTSENLTFMRACDAEINGAPCRIARCGYSGEDGFEISLPAAHAEGLARRLLEFEAAGPAGLGARNTLRLEAGLCLYGRELDERTTPIEAGLQWSIAASRRAGGARAGGFPGAERILREMEEGAPRHRIGLAAVERAPLHDGDQLRDGDGRAVGVVTSGSYAPSLERFIAMAYVDDGAAAELQVESRGRRRKIETRTMPFVAPNYRRAAA